MTQNRIGRTDGRLGRRWPHWHTWIARLEPLEARYLLSSAPLGVDDEYVVRPDTQLVVSNLATRPAADDFPPLEARLTRYIGFTVTQMQSAQPYDLLFALDDQGRVHVLNWSSGQEVSLFTSTNPITDIDVTADGRYLYGVSTAAGSSTTGLVHRFDAQLGSWETRASQTRAPRLEAIDGDRFLLALRGYYTLDLTLASWGSPEASQTAPLSTTSMSPAYDVVYDDQTGRLYGNSAGSSPFNYVYVKQLVGNSFVALATAEHSLPAVLVQTLSSDGSHYYHDKLQFDALSIAHKFREFPESILVETAGVAFGASKYFLASTGEPLGTFKYANVAYAGSFQSQQVWAVDKYKYLSRYDIPTTVVGGVLTNDTDADLNLAFATLEVGPEHGKLAFRANGTFLYRPAPGYVGPDSFTYRAIDLTGGRSAPTTVHLNVVPSNSTPVAINDFYFAPADGVLHVGTGSTTSMNFPGLVLEDEFPAERLVTQMEYSAHADVLFIREGAKSIYVVDASNRQTISTLRALNDFVDLSLSPDGRALFAVEMPTGGANPVSRVWHYNVATQRWSGKTLAGRIANVEAVSAERFLSTGEGVSFTLHNWGQGTDPLQLVWTAPGSYSYYVNTYLEYDAHTGRAILAYPRTNDLTVFQLSGDAVEQVGYFSTYQKKVGQLILSPDGRRSLYGTQVLELGQPPWSFWQSYPDWVELPSNLALTNDYAILSDGSIKSSAYATVGTLGYKVGAAHASDDGTYLWAFDADHQSLKRYRAAHIRENVLRNDFDTDRDPLTVSVVTGPTYGALVLKANGTFDYTPAAGYTGPDSFSYRASDGTSDSQLATVSLLVTPGSAVPTQPYEAIEDTTLMVDAAHGLLVGTAVPNAPQLAAELVTPPARGTLVLSGDGSFSYVPEANAHGVESFTYRVTDGVAYSDAILVFLQVASVPEPPVSRDDLFTGQEDQRMRTVWVNLKSNDFDADGDNAKTLLVSPPAHGTLSLGPYGDFEYTPNPNFNGLDTFVYQLSDGTFLSNPATVTLDIEAVNDAPAAQGDFYIYEEGLTVSADAGVLLNDSDVDGDPLSVTLQTTPRGTVTLNADGSFSFTPVPGDSRWTEFKYALSDGQGGYATGTVSLKPAMFLSTAEASEIRTVDGQEVTGSFDVTLRQYTSEVRAVSGYRVALRLPNERGVRIVGIEPATSSALATGRSPGVEFLPDGTVIVSDWFSTPIDTFDGASLFRVRYAAAPEARGTLVPKVNFEHSEVANPHGSSYHLSQVVMPSLRVVDKVQPRIVDISVSSSKWTPEFRAKLAEAGLGDLGYRVSSLDTVVWKDFNLIQIRFSEPVLLYQNAVELVGLQKGKYYTNSYQKVGETNMVNVGLYTPPQPDVLDLIFSRTWYSGISDEAGNKIYYPGAPSSQSIAFRFAFLPGDVNKSGFVNSADLITTRRALGSGNPLYSPLLDINGSGTVDQADVDAVRLAMGTWLSVPAASPATQQTTAMAAAVDASFATMTEPASNSSPVPQQQMLPPIDARKRRAAELELSPAWNKDDFGEQVTARPLSARLRPRAADGIFAAWSQ